MKRRIICSACDRTLRVPLEAEVFFHRCRPRRRTRPTRGPSYAGTTRDEARNAVFAAAVEALGGESSIWRPLEADK